MGVGNGHAVTDWRFKALR